MSFNNLSKNQFSVAVLFLVLILQRSQLSFCGINTLEASIERLGWLQSEQGTVGEILSFSSPN